MLHAFIKEILFSQHRKSFCKSFLICPKRQREINVRFVPFSGMFKIDLPPAECTCEPEEEKEKKNKKQNMRANNKL